MRMNTRVRRLERRSGVPCGCPACGADGPPGVRFISPSVARSRATVPSCPRCGVEGRWTFYIEVLDTPRRSAATASAIEASSSPPTQHRRN